MTPRLTARKPNANPHREHTAASKLLSPPRTGNSAGAHEKSYAISDSGSQPDLGDEIACWDLGGFIEQRLFRDQRRRQNRYTLATDRTEVREAGESWMPAEQWANGRSVMAVWGLPDGARRAVRTERQLLHSEVVAWLNDHVIGEMLPPEFRREFRPRSRAGSPFAQLTLGELLSEESMDGLTELAGEGIDLAAQVAGAVGSWLEFAQSMKQNGSSASARLMAEAPGILAPEQVDWTIARRRSWALSSRGAKLFRRLVAEAKQMPWKQSLEFMEGLADLIADHPGLADEEQALRDFLDAESLLGESEAMRQAMDGRAG